MTAKTEMNRAMQAMEAQIKHLTAERNAYAAAGNLLATRINTQARQIVRLQVRLAQRRNPWRKRARLRIKNIFRHRGTENAETKK